MQAVRTGLDERFQEAAGHEPIRAFVQLRRGVLERLVDGRPEVQLAFAGTSSCRAAGLAPSARPHERPKSS